MDQTDPVPFESLDALRSEHLRLLKAVRPSARGTASAGPDPRAEVHNFLARAKLTGTRLDAPPDREGAQSILDYWTATLFTLPSTGGSESLTNTMAPELTEKAGNVMLADFDPKSVDDVISKADQWVKSLSETNREIVGRILLRLVRLPQGQRNFEPVATTRPTLANIAPAEVVNPLVEKLVVLGVVRVNPPVPPTEETLSLAQNALTRQWAEYARWVDQRLRFRDTTKYWERSGRNPTAIITGLLLDRARSYHDLDDLEREFVEACRGREIRQTRNYRILTFVFGSLALGAMIMAIAAISGWYEVANTARELKKSAESLTIEQEKVNNQKNDLFRQNEAFKLTVEELNEKVKQYEAKERELNGVLYDLKQKNDQFLKLSVLADDPAIQNAAQKNPEAAKILNQLRMPTWKAIPYDPKFLGSDTPIELPKLTARLQREAFEDGKPLDYIHYSLVMNTSRRLMFFAATNVDRSSLAPPPPRTLSKYFFDARLPITYQAGDELYTQNDLDRAAIARRTELIWGNVDANIASETAFYYPNTCPMFKTLNQSIWSQLTNWTLKDYLPAAQRITIFKGPVLRQDDYRYRGYQIPRQYWLIVVGREETGKPAAMAFLIDHYRFASKSQLPDYDIHPALGREINVMWYRTKITALEALLEMDFGPLRNFDTPLPVSKS